MQEGRRRRWVLWIAAIALWSSGPSASPGEVHEVVVAENLSGQLQRGPHPVGFSKTHLLRHDPAPPIESKQPRPTELDIYRWFPSSRSAGDTDRLSYGDYYRIQESSPPSEASLPDWLLDDMTSPPGVAPETLRELLDSRMWARTDATPAPGPFPLVLWSYRDSIPTMQALLGEYLASHGYVVVFAWPRNHVPPFAWSEGVTEEQKLGALETQVDILEAVLDEMLLASEVDASRMAVISWSYGGESAQLLQRRRDEVKIVIGLDSTLVSGWVYQSKASLDLVPLSELSVPYVLFRHGQPRRGAERSPAPSLLERIPGGSWYVHLPHLMHGNFNFPGGMIPGLLRLTEVSRWAVGGEDAQLGYEVVCRLTAHYLNAELAEGVAATPDWIAALPAGFVEIVRHEARDH